MEPISILPVMISFERWTSQLNAVLEELYIPIEYREEEWWDWAIQLIDANELYAVPAPVKLLYPAREDWKRWASYFLQMMGLV